MLPSQGHRKLSRKLVQSHQRPIEISIGSESVSAVSVSPVVLLYTVG